jgi:ABC-type enterobactin transport system permease subunit
MSRALRRNRLIALVAAAAMVVVICGHVSQDLGAHPAQSCHCDWTMHFTGVAGSAPHPVPVVKPVLAGWRLPAVALATLRGAHRLRAHLARAPPAPTSIG